MSRALQAFFLVFLFTLCAFAQRTGGSFGGSRWGSGSPVVVHTSSTHVVPVLVPVSTGYTAPVHSSEPVYVAEDADDSVADTITLFVISAIVIALIVAGIAGVFRERRRW